MNLIKLAIERPVSVVAAMLMTVLFGLVALQTIPIQRRPRLKSPAARRAPSPGSLSAARPAMRGRFMSSATFWRTSCATAWSGWTASRG